MNNRLFSSLICITILAFAPACTKRQEPYSAQTSKGTSKDVKEINTMIEVDNSIFEIEEEIVTKKSISKF